MKKTFGNSTIEVVKGDITKEKVDVIVNAANAQLAGGGGVDGAIHRAGGPAIMEECKKLGGCPTGGAKATMAGELPAKWVIHAVGPRYTDGSKGEADQLAGAYRRSLEVAEEKGAKTVAFPAISCGVYGYPIPEAARIGIQTAKDYVQQSSTIARVRFVLFGDDTYGPFQEALENA